jgi:hypothetical protein
MKLIMQNKKQFKSYLVKILLGCLGAAGLLGIWALLAGNGFGPTEGRILASTVLVGIFSVLSLGYLALTSKPYEWLGVPGAIASFIFVLLGLFLLWVWPESGYERNWEVFQELVKYFVISGIVAVSCAHAGMLLLLSEGASRNVRIARIATLSAIGLVAFILIAIILNEFGKTPDMVMRLLGVFAIIDVVGTVATPALARLSSGKKT